MLRRETDVAARSVANELYEWGQDRERLTVAGGNHDLSDMFEFGKQAPMPFVPVKTKFNKTSPGLVDCTHSI